MRLSRRTLVCGTAAAGTAIVLSVAAGLTTAAPTAWASAQPAATPVPAGFKPNSLSWVSAQQGWVLGQAACGTRKCTDVAGTTDGGTAWSLLGAVNAPLSPTATGGVTELRFASPQVGWAFAPGLYRTADGGRSWTAVKIPGGGKRVLALAATTAGVSMVVSPCLNVCPSKHLTLWRTAAAGGAWTQVPVDLPFNVDADISAAGQGVYVVDPLMLTANKADKFYASTDGGANFAARPAPCDSTTAGTGMEEVVATSTDSIAELCVGQPGLGDETKSVLRSANSGTTTTSAGSMDVNGFSEGLAVSPTGDLAVTAASAEGSFIYVNDSSATTWTRPFATPNVAGFNDVTYTSGTQAWAVFAPHLNPGGTLVVTRDGGRHWKSVRP